MKLPESCTNSVKKAETYQIGVQNKELLARYVEGLLECSLSGQNQKLFLRGLQWLRELGSRCRTTQLAKLLLFLNITNIKPSTTHQKAGVSPRTSVQLRVNYQMVGVTRRKCKSVSWGVCTESKISDTMGATIRPKNRNSGREIKVYLSRLSSFCENSDTTEIEAPNVERSGIFYCNWNQYFFRGRGGCNWSVKIKTWRSCLNEQSW